MDATRVFLFLLVPIVVAGDTAVLSSSLSIASANEVVNSSNWTALAFTERVANTRPDIFSVNAQTSALQVHTEGAFRCVATVGLIVPSGATIFLRARINQEVISEIHQPVFVATPFADHPFQARLPFIFPGRAGDSVHFDIDGTGVSAIANATDNSHLMCTWFSNGQAYMGELSHQSSFGTYGFAQNFAYKTKLGNHSFAFQPWEWGSYGFHPHTINVQTAGVLHIVATIMQTVSPSTSSIGYMSILKRNQVISTGYFGASGKTSLVAEASVAMDVHDSIALTGLTSVYTGGRFATLTMIWDCQPEANNAKVNLTSAQSIAATNNASVDTFLDLQYSDYFETFAEPKVESTHNGGLRILTAGTLHYLFSVTHKPTASAVSIRARVVVQGPSGTPQYYYTTAQAVNWQRFHCLVGEIMVNVETNTTVLAQIHPNDIAQIVQSASFSSYSLSPSAPRCEWQLLAKNDGTATFDWSTLALSGLGGNTDSNYARPCAEFNHLASHFVIRVTMGTTVDYFAPTANSSVCDVLASVNKFTWASKEIGPFVAPSYASTGSFGGSALNWPSTSSSGSDPRQHLSFWGSATQAGGCCTSNYSSTNSWGQPFVMVVRGCRARSCRELKQYSDAQSDGVYTVDFTGTGSTPTKVYCDQTTSGGGWTWAATLRSQSSYPAPWPTWSADWWRNSHGLPVDASQPTRPYTNHAMQQFLPLLTDSCPGSFILNMRNPVNDVERYHFGFTASDWGLWNTTRTASQVSIVGPFETLSNVRVSRFLTLSGHTQARLNGNWSQQAMFFGSGVSQGAADTEGIGARYGTASTTPGVYGFVGNETVNSTFSLWIRESNSIVVPPVPDPTPAPTPAPTNTPSLPPTAAPTEAPSVAPTSLPSPSTSPTLSPTSAPTRAPTTSSGTPIPSTQPTRAPTAAPSSAIITNCWLSQGTLSPSWSPSIFNYTATVNHEYPAITVTCTMNGPYNLYLNHAHLLFSRADYGNGTTYHHRRVRLSFGRTRLRVTASLPGASTYVMVVDRSRADVQPNSAVTLVRLNGATATNSRASLLCGGVTGTTLQSSCQAYTPETNLWAPYASFSLSQARQMLTAAVIGDAMVFVGGISSFNTSVSLSGVAIETTPYLQPVMSQVIDILYPNGTSVALSLSTARSSVQLVVDGDILYMIGGVEGSLLPSCAVDRFNMSSQSMMPALTLSTCRAHMSVARIGGQVVVAGGLGTGGTPLNTVEAYNPTANEFEASTAQLPEARSLMSTVVYGDRAYLFSGKLASGTYANSVIVLQGNSSSKTLTVGTHPHRSGSRNELQATVGTSISIPVGRLFPSSGVSGFFVVFYGGYILNGMSIPTLSGLIDYIDTRDAAVTSSSTGNPVGRANTVTGPNGMVVVGGSSNSPITVSFSTSSDTDCQRLNFCSGRGTCVGTAPNDACDCIDGWTGESCASLKEDIINDAETVVGLTFAVAAAIALVLAFASATSSTQGDANPTTSASSSASSMQRYGYGLLPYLTYMQDFVLALEWNTEIGALFEPFKNINYLLLNGPGDTAENVKSFADDAFFFWHNMGFKLIVLVVLTAARLYAHGAAVVHCAGVLKLRGRHFTWLFAFLFIPVWESAYSGAHSEGWFLATLLTVVSLALLWTWVWSTVRPALTPDVLLYLIPAGPATTKVCNDDSYSVATLEEEDKGFAPQESKEEDDEYRRGLIGELRLRTDKLKQRIAATRRDWKWQFKVLRPTSASPGESSVNFPSSNHSAADDNGGVELTVMSASSSSTSTAKLSKPVASDGGLHHSDSDTDSDEEELVNKMPVIDRLRSRRAQRYVDAWSRFPYQPFFTDVLYHAPSESSQLQSVRSSFSHFFGFIELSYFLVFVYLAVQLDGQPQLYSLCALIVAYMILAVVLFPWPVGRLCGMLAQNTILTIQLAIFGSILHDGTGVHTKLMVIVIGQMAVLPLYLMMKRLFDPHREEDVTRFRVAARQAEWHRRHQRRHRRRNGKMANSDNVREPNGQQQDDEDDVPSALVRATTNPEDLAPEWERFEDDKTKIPYYVHKTTGEKTWETPIATSP